MIRVVCQHTPTLYGITGLFDEAQLTPVLEVELTPGERATYYRAETHDHWVLYKRAVTGSGALPAGQTFNPEQR